MVGRSAAGMGRRLGTKMSCRVKYDKLYRAAWTGRRCRTGVLRNSLRDRGMGPSGGCGMSFWLSGCCASWSLVSLVVSLIMQLHRARHWREPDSPEASRIRSRRGWSNTQHCCTRSPHRPLELDGGSAESILTWLIMTTYGVSAAEGSLAAATTSACSLADDSGARCAVYDMGIEIPVAAYQSRSYRGETGMSKNANRGYSRLRNRIAPSRHSGLNSLSAKLPSNSETTISANSGISIFRISPKMISTVSCHSSSLRSCNLHDQLLRTYSFVDVTDVMKALAFFSTAYTIACLFDRFMALRAQATSGPRPAPTTTIVLLISLPLFLVNLCNANESLFLFSRQIAQRQQDSLLVLRILDRIPLKDIIRRRA